MNFAYYNEFDPSAAAWLRELIKRGLITDGEVDERSVLEVQPEDLKGFTRHHFFAGIGVWDYALQGAGFPADRRVLTASTPCQPFSSAGAQKGKADERHLLPHFLELVLRCDMPLMFFEQVEAAIKHSWLDELHDSLPDYEVATSIIPAAAVGAPHIRSRLWAVAVKTNEGKNVTSRTIEQAVRNSFTAGERDLQAYAQRNQDTSGSHSGQNISGSEERTTTGLVDTPNLRDVRRPCEVCKQVRRQERPDVYEPVGSKCLPCRVADMQREGREGRVSGRQDAERGTVNGHLGCDSAVSRLGNASEIGRQQQSDGLRGDGEGMEQGRREQIVTTETSCGVSRLGDTEHDGCSIHSQRSGDVQPSAERRENGQDVPRESEGAGGREESAVLPRRFIGRETWSNNIVWLYCRDEKYRPVKSRPKFMVDGASNRVDKGFSKQEITYAAENERDTVEVLRTVQHEVGTEEVQDRLGGLDPLYEAEVLRPEVHGGEYAGQDSEPNSEKFEETIRQNSWRSVCYLWEYLAASSPPHRREPYEQRVLQLEDIVLGLSHAITLADMESDSLSSEKMYALREACQNKRVLSYTPDTFSEIWRSVNEEKEDRTPVVSGAFIRVATAPLLKAESYEKTHSSIMAGKSRAVLLKGFGNAINSVVAKTFIEAFLNTET